MSLKIVVRATKTPNRARLRRLYDVSASDKLEFGIHDSLRGVSPTRGSKTAVLVVVDDFIKNKDIIARASKRGWRLALPGERDAFSQAARALFKRGLCVVDLATTTASGDVMSIFHSTLGSGKPAIMAFRAIQPNLPQNHYLFIRDAASSRS